MAKEAKHTPGPWRAYKDRVYATCRSGREEVIVNADSPYVQNAEANALLIAAAPELLEALMELAYNDGWHKNVKDTEILVYRVRLVARMGLYHAGALATQGEPEVLETPVK